MCSMVNAMNVFEYKIIAMHPTVREIKPNIVYNKNK